VAQWIGGDAVSGCSTPISVPEFNGQQEPLSVWNSTESTWTIQLPYEDLWSVSVFDATGNEIRSEQVTGKQGNVDLPDLAHGIYIVRATDHQGVPFTAKIAVQ